MKKGGGGLGVPAEGGLAVGTASECPLRALGTRALAPGLVLFVQWMGLWGCEVSPTRSRSGNVHPTDTPHLHEHSTNVKTTCFSSR